MNMRWIIGVVLACSVAVAPAQKITVVTEEYPPFNYSEGGRITGFSTEVVEEVLKRARLEFDLGIYPWARAYQMAQEAPNVLIYSIGRNDKREALFQWVDVIAPYDVYLFRLKSRTDIKVTDMASLRRYKVGAVRDDVRAQFLEAEGIKADLVTDDGVNVKKLSGQRIDMFPIDELAMVALYKREGVDPNTLVKVMKLDRLSSGLYMAFSRQTPEDLVNRCRVALAEMKKDGSFERLRAKYLK